MPYRFDVHALFFADDAVSVEAELYRVFADRRVNQVNQRREFFYATPAEVIEALRRNVGEVISSTEDPEGEESL
nr:GIY-YIG nuclease family protein [Rhodococcus sp. 06-621-2]